MLEQPALAAEVILAAIRQHYGIPVVKLAFLPLGNSSNTWVYQVSTVDERSYFVKLKRGAVDEPSLLIPDYLRCSGIEAVLAPLPNQAQQLWQALDGYVLMVYPFIDGRTGMEQGLSGSQWQALGVMLKQIHDTHLPSHIEAKTPTESFSPGWCAIIHEITTRIAEHAFDDPVQRAGAAFWKDKLGEIQAHLERIDHLGRQMQQRSRPFVLCHADIHTANVLVDRDGDLHIVDWDEVLLAPKERDLIFILDSSTTEAERPAHESAFLSGYGPVEVDEVAMAYYRCEWMVQEIGDYGQRLFLMPDVGEVIRQDALIGLREQFPG